MLEKKFLFQNRNEQLGTVLKILYRRQSMENLKFFCLLARVIVTSRRYC